MKYALKMLSRLEMSEQQADSEASDDDDDEDGDKKIRANTKARGGKEVGLLSARQSWNKTRMPETTGWTLK
jgi:hypothetical protein